MIKHVECVSDSPSWWNHLDLDVPVTLPPHLFSPNFPASPAVSLNIISAPHCEAVTAVNCKRTQSSLGFFASPFFSPSILFIPPSSPAPHVGDFYLPNASRCAPLSLSLSLSLSHADDNLSIRGKSIYKLNKMTWYPSSPLVHQPVQTRRGRLASRRPGSSETAR